ncbi:MAG: hypothetical protein A3I39_02210 [Candidatus Yanofskybacteria bacterium RIFCSPLOWO2_02_FULL_47_9b]|uniref:Uncharacterized protein n=1 Tax=Candidatus Yanofskybacteria bacterium RIFCSPLOWO2_02_FULL_47_9b TaxID=1802708 RepID=A0A1F8H6C1_9BACT|nr:MAG: hypothetical protein A3I39_02210 [Candidatus Yanofskybacteria bacterium RIFCSPLOWO2_02_FULL_47_9b]
MLGTCAEVGVIKQATDLVSRALQCLNGQSFEKVGEVRTLVQQAQMEIRSQTAKLNSSFRVSVEVLSLDERVWRANENIACAEDIVEALGNPLRQLAKASTNRRVGAVRSLLNLQPDLVALSDAIEEAEERLKRFPKR